MKKVKRAISLIMVTAVLAQAMLFSGCKTGDDGLPQYEVSTSATVGGQLTADASKAAQGEEIAFKVTPDEGYVLEKLEINGGEVEVIGNVFYYQGVLSDITAKAYFVRKDVTVCFDGSEIAIPDQTVKYGKPYGELPEGVKKNQRFVGWKDESGKIISDMDIVDKAGTIMLTAVWTELTDLEKDGLVPYSATTAYYDMAATKYGVVFHTKVKPSAPRILLAENGDGNFDNATEIYCEYNTFFNEYVCNGVVDNLKFGTEYSVKFGDYSADTWSKTYTFTTREEKIEETSFFYVTDSQQNASKGDANTSGIQETTYWDLTMSDAVARFPNAAFTAHGGDIIDYAAEPAYWKRMLDSVEEYLFQYPLMNTPGNHEGDGWYSAGHACIGKLFNIDTPTDTEMGYYYSFDYGPMHFVSSLSNDIFYHYDGKYTKAQLDWLRSDLAAARENPEIKWIVMMTHHGIMTPTFSKVASGAFNPITYAQLMPILDEYDVDLLLYGHNHYLDSTYPIVWTNEIEKTVFEDYSYVNDYVDYYKIATATRTTKKTLHDGVEVDEFVYADGVTNRGTVMHQTACVGDQWNTTYSLAKLEENLAKKPDYRMLLSGGKGAIDEKIGYSMYSYVEVDQEKLVCRTYGVDVVSQFNEPSLENGKYLDGFLLRK